MRQRLSAAQFKEPRHFACVVEFAVPQEAPTPTLAIQQNPPSQVSLLVPVGAGLHRGFAQMEVAHCCPRAAYGSWHFFALLALGSARQRSVAAVQSVLLLHAPVET